MSIRQVNFQRKMISVDDLREAAAQRLPRMIFDLVDGAALDEITARRNVDAFRRIELRQRALVDISGRDLSRAVFGRKIDFPVMISPVGMLVLLHPDGDLAAARAAARSGTILAHSGWSGSSLEELVEAVGPETIWEQVAFWKDRTHTERQLEVAERLGVEVVVVAGDVYASSKRERELRHRLTKPLRPPVRDLLQTATRLRWSYGYMTGPRVTWGNFENDGHRIKVRDMDEFMKNQQDPSANWEDVRWLRERWQGKVVVKGIMSPEDAALAADAGVDGVFVSNHGGRQFDGQQSSIEALPAIVEELDGRCEVFLDSGIRRGTDVLKAIALGASACFVGRPAAYGLGAAGQRGVERALDILRAELDAALGFVGHRTLDGVDRSVIGGAAGLD